MIGISELNFQMHLGHRLQQKELQIMSINLNQSANNISLRIITKKQSHKQSALLFQKKRKLQQRYKKQYLTLISIISKTVKLRSQRLLQVVLVNFKDKTTKIHCCHSITKIQPRALLQNYFSLPQIIGKDFIFVQFFIATLMLPFLAFLLFLLLQLTYSSLIFKASSPEITYPIKFTYVNKVLDWSSAAGLAKSIGVPGYSNHSYSHIALTFFTCQNGPLDAALLWDKPSLYFGTTTFGSTDDAIRTNIKALFSSKGIKLMVSAFGSTQNPTTQRIDPIQCANNISNYVIKNQLDGVDVDWQDTAAFNTASGGGQRWLITLTQQLRDRLPSAIITHAPQGPYFGGTGLYPNNAYLAINQAVGSSIQFYNIQFYNQGTTPYNTAKGLFNESGGWAPGTSVNQIIAKGIPKEKIVVGKPATTVDANSGSYMTPALLNSTFVAAYNHNQWKTGVMFWQFSSDSNSSILSTTVSGLLELLNKSNNTSTISYPIKFTCINKILNQSSDTAFLKSIALSTGTSSGYNYVSFYSWTFRSGPQGSLLFWVNPSSFLTSSYRASRSNSQLRDFFKKQYQQKGIKVLLNAFGNFQSPTTSNYNAFEVANNLAQFVTTYNLDGVDVDYQDSRAFVLGTAEQWLSDFTIKLRQLLPKHLIVHTTNAGYFTGQPIFKNGGYLTVNSKVGSSIDFYNVRYFNQGSSVYNTAQTLFNVSSGWALKTSVNQLIGRGVDSKKIVVAKPATIKDADSPSFMTSSQLNSAIAQQYTYNGWKTGIMLYQFASDTSGSILNATIQSISGN